MRRLRDLSENLCAKQDGNFSDKSIFLYGFLSSKILSNMENSQKYFLLLFLTILSLKIVIHHHKKSGEIQESPKKFQNLMKSEENECKSTSA